MASSKRGFALTALGSAASLLGVYVLCSRLYDRRKEEEEDDDTATKRASVRNESVSDLPPHLQRQLYKEERRKKSIRFLALKKKRGSFQFSLCVLRPLPLGRRPSVRRRQPGLSRTHVRVVKYQKERRSSYSNMNSPSKVHGATDAECVVCAVCWKKPWE